MSELSPVLTHSFRGVASALGTPAWRRPWSGRAGAVLLLVAADLAAGALAAVPAAGRLADPLLAAAAANIVAVNAGLRLYDTAAFTAVERFRRRVLGAMLLPYLALAEIALLQPAAAPSLALLFVAAALALPLGLAGEAGVRRALPAAWNAAAVFVGAGEGLARAAAQFAARPEFGLRPVGLLSDAPTATATLPWLGRIAELAAVAPTVDAVVIVSSPDLPEISPVELPVRRVMVLPEAAGLPTVTAALRHFGHAAGLEWRNPPQHGATRLLKRALDLCVAVPLLILSAPLVALLALAVRAVSPGSPIYVQKRVGWHGREIAVYKLRSMYVDAEARLAELLAADPQARQEWERHMKLKADPRVLPYLGAFIRKTSLDELPQLWNVVRGDIGLVGPRPFPGYHIEKFPPAFRDLRSSVKPGLTGLWQVSDRSDADLGEQERIDTYYIRNRSLWLDAHIVLRTVPAMLNSRGAR